MMDLLNWLNDLALMVTDPMLNWMLSMPLDVALLVVAVGTSFIMTIVRIWTTDQKFLKLCDEDKKRLGQLIKEAKKRGDKEAVQRHRTTKGMVALKTMKYELKPLLWVIIPVALLGTWAFNRLGFHPPQAGETVEIIGYFPVGAVDQRATLLPIKGLQAENGWIQEIKKQELTEEQINAGWPVDGEARWKLKGEAAKEPYLLDIRFEDMKIQRKLEIGNPTYAMTLEFHNDEMTIATETKLKEFKLFGIVPGIEALMCPPWLMAYLIIAVIFVFIFKPVLKIY